jgi:hypothetical protein
MTVTATLSTFEYANAVREALDDLAPHEAQSVLEGLDDHLSEITAEGAEDLEVTLGTPAAYAAELRASAGYESRKPDLDESAPQPQTPTLTSEPMLSERSFFDKNRTLMARGTILLFLGVVAIAVTRISQPVNGIELLFGSGRVLGVSAPVDCRPGWRFASRGFCVGAC